MRGRVFRRGAGWSYTVDLQPDPATGKRRQRMKGGFATKREAERALASVLVDVEAGTVMATAHERLDEWLEAWLVALESTMRPTTFQLYRLAVRSWIVPRIGGLRLEQVTPQVLQDLYVELGRHGRADGAGGLSPRSVRLAHQVLHQAFEKAVDWRLLRTNPAAARLELPRMTHAPMQTWTLDELQRFLGETESDRLGPLWSLLLATGLRRGEALGLRWVDVDLDRGRLSVVRTVVVVGGRAVVSEPKTAASRRSVSISPEVVAVLRAHRRRQAEERLLLGPAWEESGLVFTTTIGGVIHPRNLVRSFDQAVARASVPRIRIHDLRHTAATLALRNGVHPKLVQELLGHTKVSITLDIYSHTTPEMHDDAAATIGRAIFSPASRSKC